MSVPRYLTLASKAKQYRCLHSSLIVIPITTNRIDNDTPKIKDALVCLDPSTYLVIQPGYSKMEQ